MSKPARLALTLSLAGILLSGCEALYFMGGKGKQPALFQIPKEKRVLVLVDVRDGVSAPPAFASNLADQIGTHLYRNQGIDHLVSQDRVIALQSDPVAFKKLGVADIARAADADVVLAVYITQLETPKTIDGTVSSGTAQLQVKVIDRNGERMWPGEVAGARVEAHVDSSFTSDRDTPAVLKEMSDLLALRTGRMFHQYSLEDKAMMK